MKESIKIKEFAELTGLSIRTLQYYHDIQLLEPASVNEYGHRFYDAFSFSKVFVIQSLKEIGMSLEDIKNYLNRSDFNIHSFIREEKRRTVEKITDLQLKLMQLDKLERQGNIVETTSPYILPLLAKEPLSAEAITDYQNNQEKLLDFDIAEWQKFVRKLNDCCKNNLPIENKRAKECVQYWKKNVLNKNKQLNLEELTTYAEKHYQLDSNNHFGLTEKSYIYLNQLLKLDTK